MSIAPVVFLALVGYFSWNATKGDHGLVAYAERKQLLQQAEADQASARTERDVWARRVSGLQAEHIDADQLDEQARAMLNLSDPADIVVMYPAKDKLF
jgi:cell division protein FtsB